jgi:hypothetical protein
MAKLKSGTRIYGTATVDTSVSVGSGVTISGNDINVSGVLTATSGNFNQIISSSGANISGIVTISVSNPSSALTITQTGNGNALVVEDITNPDATPFVIDSSGFVGIGTTNPQNILHIEASNARVRYVETDATADNRIWNFGANDQEFSWQAFNDAGTGGGSRFVLTRSGNLIQEFQGYFAGSPWFAINNPNQRVGIGSTIPSTKLDVIGDARVSGVVTAMTFSGQVNAGVSTLGITTTAGLSATQLSISGVSTFAGITTVTGTTLFSRQLNVSGVSTFNNTLNVVPTSTGIAGLFSGTTSSDMVRITQLGTGNALVVEDSTNPDSTPFVISGGGNVGIGTTNPFGGVIGNNGLDVNLSSAIIFARNKDTTGESSVWSVDNDWFSTPSYKGVGIRNFGTSTAGNVLGSIPFASGGALAFQNTSYGLIYTNGGSPLIFGTLATEALRIDTSQRVGIKTTNPSFDVDISGDARIQSTNKMRFGGTSGTTNFYIQYNSTTNSLDFVAG